MTTRTTKDGIEYDSYGITIFLRYECPKCHAEKGDPCSIGPVGMRALDGHVVIPSGFICNERKRYTA